MDQMDDLSARTDGTITASRFKAEGLAILDQVEEMNIWVTVTSTVDRSLGSVRSTVAVLRRPHHEPPSPYRRRRRGRLPGGRETARAAMTMVHVCPSARGDC
jgi:hypothetical protein